jgi:O-antigen/teichoic acid export membrane protein
MVIRKLVNLFGSSCNRLWRVVSRRGHIHSWFRGRLTRMNLKSYLPSKGSFAGNVLTLMTGTVLSQVVTIAVTPILTRLYAPDDYGVLAVYTSIITLLIPLASWSYEWAIPVEENDESAANLLCLCLIILLAMSLLTALSLVMLSDSLVIWVKSPRLKSYLWLIPISLLGAGTYQALNQYATRKKAYSCIAKTRLNQSLGRALAQVGLGLLKFKPLGLFLGDVIGRVSGTRSIAAMVWQEDGATLKKATIPGMRGAAHRHRSFPIFFSSSLLLSNLSLALPVVLISAFYGPEVVGQFSLSQKLIAIPISFVTSAVSQVFFAEASSLVHSDLGELKRLLFKMVRKLLLVAIPIAFLSLISPWIIQPVFGEVWGKAGIYAQALTLMFVTQIVGSPVALLFNILEVMHWRFLWDIGRLILTVGSFYISYSLSYSPAICIFIYSLAMSLAYTAGFIICIDILGRFKPKTA